MTIERKLDEILNILYDDKELLFKQVPATNIIAFGKKKYNLDWSNADIVFIMSVLINDGYVIMNKGVMPTYSLTTKGIQLKHKGGFRRTKLVENLKNYIILWGSIFTLIVSIITIYDFIKETWGKSVPSIICEKNYKADNKDTSMNYDKLNKSTTKINIIKPDTISKSIKK